MFASKISSRLVSLVFPPCCFGCGKEMAFDGNDHHQSDLETGAANETAGLDLAQHHWCATCTKQLFGNVIDRCHTCGATTATNNPFGDRCNLCREFKNRFARAVSIGDYRELLQEITIQMKREKSDALAIQLGYLLATQIEKYDVPDCDGIVAIPTHWTRHLRRGFQAASVIADGISQQTGIPVQRRLLRCSKTTKKQGTLSNTARFQNMRNAFHVSPKADLKQAKILLVDDVMTSGATINDASRALLRAGAAEVYVAVVARGARVS